MASRPRPKAPTQVDALRHRDKRANIPTDELRGFVEDQESGPATAHYPRWRSERDTSLDPQLVWKGKDAQDLTDLEVPTVPIYIQEKVHPRVIIENLRQTAAAGEREPELTLFDDFNGIEFEDLIDFYEHEQNWANRLILGDALLVMTSLAEKEGLKGKVQTIYIDPPYGINFGSNWQTSTANRQVRDGRVEDFTREPEQIRAFRDTWEDGIHSYLGYLRDRLSVARELLSESGSVFVQIGDENAHLVRSLLDEKFGGDNFIAEIHYLTTSGRAARFVDSVTDRVLWYARDRDKAKYRNLWRPRPAHTLERQYTLVELEDGSVRRVTAEELAGTDPLPEGARRFTPGDMSSTGASEAGSRPFELDGTTYTLPANTHWKTNREGMRRLAAAGRLYPIGKRVQYRRYSQDFPIAPLTNVWDDTVISGFTDPKVYVVQTNTKVVERCVLMTSDPGDLVLDPTCGSGTTAVVAEQWGRRWITIDTSRVAVALARTRIAALRLPYYQLADSVSGRKLESELTGHPPSDEPPTNDVRRGFVYKRIPHIMLKSIAQNPDIREGISREEIDAAIARHAEQELLVDQPYEDKRIVRVCGPFTVESLSPHRMLSREDHPETEIATGSDAGYEQRIIENLLKAGVQNRDRRQRLELNTLEPYPGTWINAHGEFTDEAGETRRVGISLGPEYGTVGSEQVREAAKEAVKGLGFDLLLVCGFAFDAHGSEAATEFQPESSDGWAVAAEERKLGRLPVLLVRMNTDLTMGDELLKKTGAGNLFMVFGEPDITIDRTDGGKVEVEVHGVDVYDPTTGEVRSDSTDEIACWFIDNNYNGESFFVRDAYFTGANDPYKRLKAALKADIDEDAWASLYRTRSRPFDPPETGTIAVKVINHHGDEVLKTYDVE